MPSQVEAGNVSPLGIVFLAATQRVLRCRTFRKARNEPMKGLQAGVYMVVCGAKEGDIVLKPRRFGSDITVTGSDAVELRRRFCLIDGFTITVES